MASVTMRYPRSQSALVYRHGQKPKGQDRFYCRDYHRVFYLHYTYQARKPSVKKQINEMALNVAESVVLQKRLKSVQIVLHEL